MPKIREAINSGEVRLSILVNEEKDLAAIDLLEHIIAECSDGQTVSMKNVLQLLDTTRWWAISLASAYGFQEFLNNEEEENGETR